MFEKLRFRERLMAEYLPFVSHVSDRAILMADHSVLAAFELDGLCPQTAEPETLNLWHDRLNGTLLNIAGDSVILHTYQCRGAADPGIYPQGKFTIPFAEALDVTYRERLFEGSLYWNRLFLMVQVRPANYAGEWLGEKLSKRRTSREAPPEALDDRLHRLEKVCSFIEADLARYGVRRLGVVERGRGLFSEIAEAIAFALTGLHRPVGLTTGRIGNALLAERMVIGPESIEMRGPGRSHYAACLAMRDYPARTWPGVFGGLMSGSYRSTLAQSFRFIGSADADTLINRKQNRGVSAGDKARSQLAELGGTAIVPLPGAPPTLADDIASKRVVLGDHSLVYCVFARTIGQLNDVVTAAWHDLAESSVSVSREDKALEAAFASMVPGNARFRVRPGAVTSRNFAAMSAWHNYPSGDRAGHWGEPTALFRSTGRTPYRFHLHVNDLGNTFVSGRAGSGKTTWLGFIAAQADRSGAQVVLWDKDRGLEIFVRACGGSYLPLRTPSGLSLLKGLDNTEENRLFQARLIRGMIGQAMTAEEDRRLAVALRSVMSLDPEDRWLREVRAFLGTGANGAGARLEKWCWGGELGGVVDCPEDTLRLDARVIGFDQTKILDNPDARGPVMALLYHRVESLIDGRRLLFIVDEFWKSLEDESFRDLVHDKLKTLRKQNSPVLLATQSPRDALRSVISHTVREQCPTQVYFSNAAALWSDHGEDGMNLTHPEFEIVKQLPEASGLFLLKQGTRSVVAQLPLGGMDDEIAIISGTKPNLNAFDAARERVGDDPGELVAEFHRLRKERVS